VAIVLKIRLENQPPQVVGSMKMRSQYIVYRKRSEIFGKTINRLFNPTEKVRIKHNGVVKNLLSDFKD
jgi:hypothetical protein